MAAPGTRVINEIDHGTRAVDGTTVRITELVWNDTTGRTFEAHLGDGTDLTQDGCFDTWPTDAQISALLDASHTSAN